MKLEDCFTKPVIYGTNFLVGAVGKKFGYSLGNPFGAFFYGALDLAGFLSEKIHDNRYSRLMKLGGFLNYGSRSLINLYNLENFPDLIFDLSMAYQLGKDIIEEFSLEGNDFIEDVQDVAKDIKNLAGKCSRYKRKIRTKSREATTSIE